MTAKNQLKEFPHPSREDWKEKIAQDLKGKTFEDLIKKTPEGLELQPFYDVQDLASLPKTAEEGGEFPFTRNYQVQRQRMQIAQPILATDLQKAHAQIKEALKNQVDVLVLEVKYCQDKLYALPLARQQDFAKLFAGVGKVPALQIKAGILSPAWYFLWQEFSKKNSTLSQASSGALSETVVDLVYDPLSQIAFGATSPEDWSALVKELAAMMQAFSQEDPKKLDKIFCIDGASWKATGLSITEELAVILSLFHEYFIALSQEGLSAKEILARMMIQIGVGPRYFHEIAKVRVLRSLLAQLVASYDEAAANEALKISAKTDSWNQTYYDPHVNLLRFTTESMAANLGGVDVLSVDLFDAWDEQRQDLAFRMSRNISLVLEHEAYMGKVMDPAAGSYFIETLTEQLAEASWKIFQEIESEGGFLQSWKDLKIKERVNARLEKSEQNLSTQKDIYLGSNQYPLWDEQRLQASLGTQASWEKTPSALTLSEISLPATKGFFEKGGELSGFLDRFTAVNNTEAIIASYRGAAPLEELRLNVEAYAQEQGGAPKVEVYPFGHRAMRAARSNFALNFFACAGYAVHAQTPQNSLKDFEKTLQAEGAQIIVFCASEEDYQKELPLLEAVLTQLSQKAELFYASPQEGLYDSVRNISLKSDRLKLFRELNQKFGIIKGSQPS
ncbi:MAG: hypothetical protein H7A32_03465 [Deltaproteobacteria bacterium]|nr:hypothetical protein [Deltaproteobacteria bacterium]